MTVTLAAPPMGWNSFDSYGLHLDQDAAHANLESMASRLLPHGYSYFVVDGGWYNEYELIPGTMLPSRLAPVDRRVDDFGRYLPSRTYFPDGMRPLADRTHRLGLRFGIHIMRGIPRKAVELDLPIAGTKRRGRDIANVDDTCRWSDANFGVDMHRPGAQEYYDGWVDLLGSWGVDFIKADDITAFPAEIEALATAIERSGAAIVLSLSPGGDTEPGLVEVYRRASIVRTTKDVWDEREHLDRCFDAWRRWQDVPCGEGFWPDLDMMPLGRLRVKFPEGRPSGEPRLFGHGFTRDCLLTPDQQRTFVATRALAASPFFMGGDLPSTDDATFALVTNPQLIACGQNGVVGRCHWRQRALEVWRAPERDHAGRGWLGAFNRDPDRAATLHASLHELGLDEGPYEIEDAWEGRPLGKLETLRTEIAPDGAAFFRYSKALGEAR